MPQPNGQKIAILVQSLRSMADDAENAASPRDIRKVIWGLQSAVSLASMCLLGWNLKRYQTAKKAAALVIALSANLFSMGISCTSDSECSHWNYGMYLSCGSRTYCSAGVFYTCDSGTYYCGLDCTNGVCNNFFSVCDGSCAPMAGMCDSSVCGAEVCTPTGICTSCGDGTCDPGEDSANCPADCPMTPPPPPGPSAPPPPPGPSTPPSPPPPATPNPCGAIGAICGTTNAFETNGPLNGIAIELRTARGKVIQTKLTTSGAFSFTPGPGSYFVSAMVDRNQLALPSQVALAVPVGGSVSADFLIRGIPASLAIGNAPSGTFVLITTSTCLSPAPPSTGKGALEQSFSAVSSMQDTRINVPAGLPHYYVTCWKPPSYVTSGSLEIAQTPQPGLLLNTNCP